MDGINTCAAPLDIDPRQRYFTTVQPFSYRDTLTVLGYVQEVAEHLDQLRESVDDLAKDENADVDAINKVLTQIAAWQTSVDTALDDLAKKRTNTRRRHSPTIRPWDGTRTPSTPIEICIENWPYSARE